MKSLRQTLRAASKTGLSGPLRHLYGKAERLDSFLLNMMAAARRQKRPGDKEIAFFAQNVTFIYKSFERQDLARRLCENIRAYYPGARVIIADDSRKPLTISGAAVEKIDKSGDGEGNQIGTDPSVLILHLPFNSGLSYGLNRALERVTTPFVVRMDDDELITPFTRFGRHLRFLRGHSEVDLVAVWARQAFERGPDRQFAKLFANDMHYAPRALKIPHLTRIEENYIVVAKPVNVFIARTASLRKVGYDDAIRMTDHDEFFRRAAGVLVSVQATDSFVSHYHNIFDSQYEVFRGDTEGDAAYIRRKYASTDRGRDAVTEVLPEIKEVAPRELYRGIFPLLRSALWSERLTGEAKAVLTPDYPYWRELFRELADQTVELLPAMQIEEASISVAVMETLKKRKSLFLQHFIIIQYLQKETCELLEEAGIPVVVMKGMAAAAAYPHPELRRMGDIDLLVSPDDYPKAHELLIANGYTIDGDTKGIAHIAYRKEGIEIELHRRPPGTENRTGGNETLKVLLDGLKRREWVTVCEVEFPALPWQANGVELLWHVREHLYNGIGLRQIIDWMTFAYSYLDDTAYQEYEPVLSRCGLNDLAIALTRMCQIYLGLDDKRITWCLEADDELCVKLMDFIIEQGNFGKKQMGGEHADEEKTAKVLSRYHSPIAFFRQMQLRGLNEWSAVDKYPWLKPFAWLYTGFSGVRMLADRQQREQMMDGVKKARDRKEMLKKLGD